VRSVSWGYPSATFLAKQGVPVRVDYRYAVMHDKFIVVDGEVVETGSFNLRPLPRATMRRTSWCCMIRRWRSCTGRSGKQKSKPVTDCASAWEKIDLLPFCCQGGSKGMKANEEQ
jgi:PLD-like domain